MESVREEFDVQHYIVALIRHWPVLMITTLLGILVAVGVLLLRPPTYTAQAQLLVPAPILLWRYDAAIQTVRDPRKDARDDLIALAQTTDIAQRVIEALGDQLPPEQRAPGQLLGRVQVRKSGDSFISIDARATTPELAAAIANAWAEQVRQRANELQLQRSPLETMRTLLAEQQAELKAVEDRMEAFKAKTGLQLKMGGQLTVRDRQLVSGVALIKNELILKNALLADYRETLDRLRLFIEAVQQAQASGETLDRLPVELLDTDILLTRGRVTPETVRQQPSAEVLLALLRDEEAALSDIEAQLAREMESLQAEIVRLDLELDRIETERDLVLESVQHLKRKVRELELEARVQSSEILVASPALPPAHPNGLPTVPTLILAALLGLGVGTVLVLGWETIRPTAA